MDLAFFVTASFTQWALTSLIVRDPTVSSLFRKAIALLYVMRAAPIHVAIVDFCLGVGRNLTFFTPVITGFVTSTVCSATSTGETLCHNAPGSDRICDDFGRLCRTLNHESLVPASVADGLDDTLSVVTESA